MNLSGIVIIALGLLLAIIALRGTQHNVFPFFFGGLTTPLPDTSKCVCPPGYVNIGIAPGDLFPGCMNAAGQTVQATGC